MIILPPRIAAVLADLHTSALPGEACGFLLGRRRGRANEVSEVLIPQGAAGTAGCFEIPDHEFRRAHAYAAQAGMALVGIFHTHPSGAESLSEADAASLRFSRWPWLIVTREASGVVRFAAYSAGSGAAMAVHHAGDTHALDRAR